MGTEYKATAGRRFSAEGQIAVGCRDGFSRSVGARCQTPTQALPQPPGPVPVCSRGCRSGAATGPPTRCCCHQPRGVAAPQRAKRFTLQVGVFPFRPHRQHRQPQLWPFPLPPCTRCLLLLTAVVGPSEPDPPPHPPGPAQQPLEMSHLQERSRTRSSTLPSCQVLIIIFLAQYGKQLQQPQGWLSRQGRGRAAVEGLPLSCRTRGGPAVLRTPTTPGIPPGTQTPRSRHSVPHWAAQNKPISYRPPRCQPRLPTSLPASPS